MHTSSPYPPAVGWGERGLAHATIPPQPDLLPLGDGQEEGGERGDEAFASRWESWQAGGTAYFFCYVLPAFGREGAKPPYGEREKLAGA